MQLHKLSIFALVLALACLTNMAFGDKSCTNNELIELQNEICNLSIFPEFFMQWIRLVEPCQKIVKKVVETIPCSCSKKGDDKATISSTTTTTAAP